RTSSGPSARSPIPSEPAGPRASIGGGVSLGSAPMSTRRLAAGLLVVPIAALWAIPSDVVRLVAEQEPVILGRYSENHAYAALLLTPLLATGAALLGSRVRFDREFRFRAYAVALSFAVCFVAVDVAARFVRTPRYVERDVKALTSWP